MKKLVFAGEYLQGLYSQGKSALVFLDCKNLEDSPLPKPVISHSRITVIWEEFQYDMYHSSKARPSLCSDNTVETHIKEPSQRTLGRNGEHLTK